MTVPGVVWVSILVAISAFLAANFPDQYWVHLITVGIGAIVKALEVANEPPESSVNERLMEARHPPSKLRRFFLG